MWNKFTITAIACCKLSEPIGTNTIVLVLIVLVRSVISTNKIKIVRNNFTSLKRSNDVHLSEKIISNGIIYQYEALVASYKTVKKKTATPMYD